MELRELMSSPPIFVYLDTPLFRAARAMEDNECGFLPVVHQGVAQGVVTSGDLTAAVVLNGKCPYATTVREIMSSPPIGLPGKSIVAAAAELMRDRHVRRIIVTGEAGILRGVVSLADLAGTLKHEQIAQTLKLLGKASRPDRRVHSAPWVPNHQTA